MGNTKKIVVTGISGSGSRDFCARYAHGNLGKENVKVYDTGEMICRMAQSYLEEPIIPKENLLNLHPKILGSLQDRAFEGIINDIEHNKGRYDRIVIDTHAQFFWNDVIHNAWNWKYLDEINPDMFVTVIDKPSAIKERQMQTEQGRLQNHDLRALLVWQNAEAEVTRGWALKYENPMYVLPSRQDGLTIESLLNNPFLIYFQMPMTHANEQQDRKITKFKKELLKVGLGVNNLPTPIIDPRHIDIETGEGLSDIERRAIARQTVHRDLNWYIKEATDLVAYYPEGTTISKGVSDESTRGFETGKNAFVIYPVKNKSPFMGIATKVFESEKEFFDFFPEYMKQRIEFFRRNSERK